MQFDAFGLHESYSIPVHSAPLPDPEPLPDPLPLPLPEPSMKTFASGAVS
jgi:hypothetical protein